jgi:hypothetical protein
MKNITLVLEDVDGLDFAAGVTTLDEVQELYAEEDTCFGFYDIADAFVFGPLLNRFFEEEVMKCEIDGEVMEIPVADIPVFNTNKEIMSSDFFTPEQAEYVKTKVKWAVSDYYKTWNDGYRSAEKDLIEVEETGTGKIIADLDIEGDFNKDNLFFIQADTLPFKENSIIASVGYKNPDGSITSSSFDKDDYINDGINIKFDNEEYSEEEFEEEYS